MAPGDRSTTAQVVPYNKEMEEFPENKDNYLVKVDAISNFRFSIDKDDALAINLNLMGHYNFGRGAHELFHIGVDNIRDNPDNIIVPGDSAKTEQLRQRFARVLDEISASRGA